MKRISLIPILYILPLFLLSCESEDGIGSRGDKEENPCFMVDLLNGLDEDNPDEFINLFECLNSTGNFDDLSSFVYRLPEEEGSEGEPISSDITIIFNELWKEDRLTALLHSVSDLLSTGDLLFEDFVHSVAELIYGRVFEEIESSNQKVSVEEGILYPLLLPMNAFSKKLVQDEDDRLDPFFIFLSSLIGSSDFETLIDTMPLIGEEYSPKEFVSTSGTALIDLTENGGGENLIFPFIESLLETFDGESLISAINPDMVSLLEEERIKDELIERYISLYESSTIQSLPDGISYLMSVNKDGGTLQPNENSAFISLLIMNSSGNGPVSCWYLDLFGIDTSNLSVSILETLASYDTDTIENAINWLGEYAEYILRIANWTGCDIPDAIVDNISSLNRLVESGLLNSLVPILHAIYGGSHDVSRIPEVVHILDRFYSHGSAGIGEALYLALPQSLFSSLMDTLYIFLEHAGDGVDSLHNILLSLFSPVSPPRYNDSLLEILSSPTLTMLGETGDELDLALFRIGELLTAESTLSELLSTGQIIPPESLENFIPTLSSLLSEERFYSSLMEIMASEGVVEEMMQVHEDGGGVLPFFGRITSDGKLLDVIELIILVFQNIQDCTGYEF